MQPVGVARGPTGMTSEFCCVTPFLAYASGMVIAASWYTCTVIWLAVNGGGGAGGGAGGGDGGDGGDGN